MENKPIIAVLDNDRIQHFILEKTFRACHVEARIKNFYLVEQLTAHLIANFNNTAELPDLILMEIYLPMEDGWFFPGEFITNEEYVDQIPSRTGGFKFD